MAAAKLASTLAALAAALVLAAPAHADVRVWQARAVLYGWAGMAFRPDLNVERCWRARLHPRRRLICDVDEPGYLAPEDGRDYWRAFVERRGDQWWVRSDARLWVRVL